MPKKKEGQPTHAERQLRKDLRDMAKVLNDQARMVEISEIMKKEGPKGVMEYMAKREKNKIQRRMKRQIANMLFK